jgi:hypothetical protein
MTQTKRFLGPIGLGAVVVPLLLIAGACSKKASSPPTASYSTDLKELRDRFNTDKGKVRLLLILSPT